MVFFELPVVQVNFDAPDIVRFPSFETLAATEVSSFLHAV